MREIIYLSERKLNFMFDESRAVKKIKPRSVEMSVGVTGPSVKAGFDRSSGSMEIGSSLERVLRYLRKYQIEDFTASGLSVGEWISFDLDMRYGTGHRDEAIPGVEEDVVLFAGTAPGSSRDNLLLCGSSCHLRDRVGSTGRMGSGTEWLSDVITALDERDREGVHVIPRFIGDLVGYRPPRRGIEEVLHSVHGGVMRSEFPRPSSSRLKGIASVLMDVDNEHWVGRVVLATPLYVEIVRPNLLRKRWRRGRKF